MDWITLFSPLGPSLGIFEGGDPMSSLRKTFLSLHRNRVFLQEKQPSDCRKATLRIPFEPVPGMPDRCGERTAFVR
jgi:hypothetical protein